MTDTARKLRRMFYHLYGTASARINVNRLARLAGRTPGQISAAIRELADGGYIAWDERAGIVNVISLEEQRLHAMVGRSRTG